MEKENDKNQDVVQAPIDRVLSDAELEQVVYGPLGCSIGSVPNTCQMQSNKY